MSVRSVGWRAAGSQPALDVCCDRCMGHLRMFVDDAWHAAEGARGEGWRVTPSPHIEDLCPACQGRK